MDKRLPGLDGLETTRRLRAEERESGRRRVPIVALSASALEHERGEILAAGCDEFVGKPFHEDVVFGKMKELLGLGYVYDSSDRRHAPAPLAQEPAPDGGARVLLVVDDRISREVAREMLKTRGVAVTAASSGRQALDLLARSRFDVVFMDLHMPDMDGFEAAHLIKADPGTRAVPVIAMTAESQEDAGSVRESSPFDDYVSKPVEAAALFAALERCLPSRVSGSTPAARMPSDPGTS